MTLTQNLVPDSKYSIKCPYSMSPTRVVIHNTANDASAENEVAYMTNNDAQVSFHYAVDDIEAIQAILETRNAWHAGDGNGRGNRQGVAIEICYSRSGGPRFEQAEKNAAELTASILARYGWGLEQVTKHQDYSGKNCPHRTLALGWPRFLDMVKQALYAIKSDTTMDMHLPEGQVYTVKLTSYKKPAFTAGNGAVLKTRFGKQQGWDWYFQIKAIGPPGAGCGVYANGERLFAVTIT
ncbi:peptidoglycan recognition protein family protein [Anaeromassilibacillus senegalensis]|uniref:peptidoglycan recognition protein family protein n=1 Tax=Anaeromassilibacillus senegalensis TaxID=1673717 RepID=UPI00068250CC|nr:N-acetylmuramoyl-L-alanine amidase [Anaeromassilibacillus senegalensis]